VRSLDHSLDAWARRLVLVDGFSDDGMGDDGVGESVEVAFFLSNFNVVVFLPFFLNWR
jgi:hypothetical protein